jgi:hypothetical protein
LDGWSLSYIYITTLPSNIVPNKNNFKIYFAIGLKLFIMGGNHPIRG